MATRFSATFRALVLACGGLGSPLALAVPINVDFDAFTDLTALTNQVAGLTFSNTTVLTAGASLNEIDFPPRSGNNVGFDSGGPVTIAFSTALDSFSGFFTYVVPLTISAFDSSSALLGSVTSVFSSNFVSGGDAGSTPNEFLQLAGLGLISSVRITASAGGGSFTMDDLVAVPSSRVAVPEPSTLALLLAGSLAFALRRRRAVQANR